MKSLSDRPLGHQVITMWDGPRVKSSSGYSANAVHKVCPPSMKQHAPLPDKNTSCARNYAGNHNLRTVRGVFAFGVCSMSCLILENAPTAAWC